MKAKVTERGVTVPKELLEGMDEVEIYRQDGMVIIRSTSVADSPAWHDDPISQLGKNPVTLDVTDASENLDRYLYDAV